MSERTTAWLIEWPEGDNNPVRWWNPAHGWMRDANKAIAFARKTDADCYLSTMKFGLHLKTTEHVFVGTVFRHVLPGHAETMAALDALTIRKSPHPLKAGNLFNQIPIDVPFHGCAEKDCLPECNLGKGHCQRLADASRAAGYADV